MMAVRATDQLGGIFALKMVKVQGLHTDNPAGVLMLLLAMWE